MVNSPARIDVDGSVLADQLQFKLEGLRETFFEGERNHFEGFALQGLKGEAQVALAGHGTSLL
jgi:hypothetical protein